MRRRAIVVGSGPNGLTAAARLACAGMDVTVYEAAEEIGGGTRSGELTLPGLVHDHCSAIHPLAVASHPDLAWARAPIDLAHPLDDGTVAVMVKDIAATAHGLGRDGRRWQRMFALPGLTETDVLRPLTAAPPRHPQSTARFGLLAALPASTVARAFATPQARALFAGVAAHGGMPQRRPMSAAAGVALIWAGHRHGWPVAVGGSRAIADTLAADVVAHGGRIVTGRRVADLNDLDSADVVLLDVAPADAARILGDRLPARTARAYRRCRPGPGTFKLDLAVDGGIPWRDERCRRAGTVHAIGGIGELAAALRSVDAGTMPKRPFVVVTQQAVADPGRSRGALAPVSVTTQVPRGWHGDATEAILAQVERFAPDVRARLRAVATTTPADLARTNANLAGGDILAGSGTLTRALFGPRIARSPYATGLRGVFLCSAATPPGPGAHGRCGHHAARTALAWLERRDG